MRLGNTWPHCVTYTPLFRSPRATCPFSSVSLSYSPNSPAQKYYHKIHIVTLMKRRRKNSSDQRRGPFTAVGPGTATPLSSSSPYSKVCVSGCMHACSTLQVDSFLSVKYSLLKSKMARYVWSISCNITGLLSVGWGWDILGDLRSADPAAHCMWIVATDKISIEDEWNVCARSQKK